MNRLIWHVVASVLAFCGTASDASAVPGIPIPIIWGSGEKLTKVGDLPADVSRAVAEELGTSVSVGFLYEHLHVFYLDVWTWNGRHVLYSGDQYWEPDSSAWRSMIGEEPSAKYGKPFGYRIPLLPAALLVLFAGYGVRKRFFKSEDEKLQALMADKRYQKPIETLFGERSDGAPAKLTTSLDERLFATAKDLLLNEGIAAHVAEANLRKIVDVMLAHANAKVDTYLSIASQLEQQGEWDECANVYTQLISLLPESDARLGQARVGLESVNKKGAAAATDQGDTTEPGQA